MQAFTSGIEVSEKGEYEGRHLDALEVTNMSAIAKLIMGLDQAEGIAVLDTEYVLGFS